MRCYRYAPWQLPDGDRLDWLAGRGGVDEGDVVRQTVGADDRLAVWRKRQLPHPLSNQYVLLNLVGLRIDDGNTVGRAERDIGLLAVGGNAYTDWLDLFRAQALHPRMRPCA